jgi:hypothetical protein
MGLNICLFCGCNYNERDKDRDLVNRSLTLLLNERNNPGQCQPEMDQLISDLLAQVQARNT